MEYCETREVSGGRQDVKGAWIMAAVFFVGLVIFSL